MEDEHLRTVALAFALLCLAVGTTVFFLGSRIVDRLSYEALVSLEVLGRLALYLVLVLFVVHGYRVVRHRVRNPVEEAPVPNREAGLRVPGPGEDLHRAIDSIRSRSDSGYETIRDRIHRVALVVLADSNESPEEALEDGRWTGDEVAAATLSPSVTPDRSLVTRIRRTLDFEAIHARRELRRTMTAVAAAAGVPVEDERRLRTTGATTGRRVDEPAETGGTDRSHQTADDPVDVSSTTRRTGHWDGVSVIAIGGLILGVYYQLSSLVLAATVGIGFAAYGRLGDAPDPAIRLERTVSDANPAPGDEVDVQVAIHNEGARRLSDLRFIDGVPGALAVSAGSPRRGMVLDPGEREVVRYTITARRGEFAFEPAQVLVRDLTGAFEVEERVTPDVKTTITCLPRVDTPVSAETILRDRGLTRAGTLSTSSPGRGVEFHSVRAYQAGDPVSHVDWNRYARMRELTTVSYHEERSATVVLAVDARRGAYLAPPGLGSEHAVDRSVAGSAVVLGSLLDAGHSVGLAAVAPDSAWLAPARGAAHLYRARNLLATADAFDPTPPRETTVDLAQFDRLPSDAQVVFFSPLCDDASAAVVRTLQSNGFAVTVVAPDPTGTDGPEAALVAVERRCRIRALRGDGVAVVDWDWQHSLEHALRGGP